MTADGPGPSSNDLHPDDVHAFFDLFDRVYVINLAARSDRRREMADQFRRIGVSFPGGKFQLFEAQRPDNPGPFPTIGARGCYLSHLGVLQDAAAAGLQSILVLEDDLNFSRDFAVRSAEFSRQLRAEPWSVFYGGYEIDELNAAAPGCTLIPPTQAVCCLHFVAVRGEAIAQAADFLAQILQREPGDPAGGPMHVDGAYFWFRRANPQYLTLAAVPELGHQRASRTDIHDWRWFDRLPATRPIAAWVRKLRN